MTVSDYRQSENFTFLLIMHSFLLHSKDISQNIFQKFPKSSAVEDLLIELKAFAWKLSSKNFFPKILIFLVWNEGVLYLYLGLFTFENSFKKNREWLICSNNQRYW